MAFHWKHGWYFERLNEKEHNRPDGTVKIFHSGEAGVSPGNISLYIDPASWASIVASVTASGDNAETFSLAEKLHQK